PHIVAFVSDEDAPWWLTGPLAAVVAGLGALVTYFTDAPGVGTWKEARGVFLAAVVAAQGSRQGIDPGTVKPLAASGAHVGKPKTSAVALPAGVAAARAMTEPPPVFEPPDWVNPPEAPAKAVNPGQ